MPRRSEMWDRLGGTVDLLVVGGGINGAGIARDAARRGLRVALVEMGDLASGTSSRSSKLVHGGLRYLEQLELSLVFEAVSERRILMDIAPHMVNPLGFLFPVYKASRRRLWQINAGMWIYDGLSLFRSPKLHRKLGSREAVSEEPALGDSGLKGAALFYDCSTDDARLTLESALDATQLGAVVATWAQVTAFLHDDSGRVIGAQVRDGFTGTSKSVHAHAVVNATGPWTDRTLSLSQGERRPVLRPTKGVHIVVPRDRLPVNNAVVCFHPDDGRVLFAIPWGEVTYVGTTDTDFEGDPGEVHATSDDVDYLISASNAHFPHYPLARDDVRSTWAGLRPLMAPDAGDDVSESQVSREHQILIGPDGVITIAGGKLTTYRRMSAEVVDTAVKLLRLSNQLRSSITAANTDTEPLPGAVGWPSDDDHDRVARQISDVAGEGILSAATARLLADTYGMRGIDVARRTRQDRALAAPLIPGRPEILAQVGWAVQEELAATVADVLVRRTQVYYRDADQGLGCVETVAGAMGGLLDWSADRLQGEVEDYRAVVAASRRWRDGLPG